MVFSDTLTNEIEAQNLEFLVIGGHAVAAHGYVRTTEDVDILACKDQCRVWIDILVKHHYSLHHDGGNFLQFNPPHGEVFPLDIMLVNQSTFKTMLDQSMVKQVMNRQLRFVSLHHLLALKLFALKQEKLHRSLKDMDDVLTLIERNRVDVRESSFRELAQKYGSSDLYDKILQANS